MIRVKFQRMFAAACVLAAAAVVPVVTAAPAQASVIDCQTYLLDVGYKVGDRVTAACFAGHDLVRRPYCVPQLLMIGVKERHAKTACNMAW
ncbi:hypothetical protein [Streptomyces sp. NPDC059071]|uniref:hypothetical protein n=1 Tax=unclassified Streptomyces TaxID=2593676 RepID=UPI003647834A